MGLVSYLGASVISGLLAVVLFMAAYHIVDRATPEVNFVAEIKNGNLAVGLVLAGLFVGLGLAISGIF
ncbi:MAG: DUF350 domain-containing protein [Candidatus Alcyoniella australis]|nr:DUF350 domain-containing protein [Candidatus Alcyoniella australis]